MDKSPKDWQDEEVEEGFKYRHQNSIWDDWMDDLNDDDRYDCVRPDEIEMEDIIGFYVDNRDYQTSFYIFGEQQGVEFEMGRNGGCVNFRINKGGCMEKNCEPKLCSYRKATDDEIRFMNEILYKGTSVLNEKVYYTGMTQKYSSINAFQIRKVMENLYTLGVVKDFKGYPVYSYDWKLHKHRQFIRFDVRKDCDYQQLVEFFPYEFSH